MDTAGLSLDQAPPITIPFKYFLTAALFSIAVGLLFTLHGGDVMSSRWSPLALGITHLITVGFIAQVMTGAMMQLLPVLAGSPIPKVVAVSWVVHLSLLAGTALLVFGFLSSRELLLIAGGITLSAAFLILLTSTGMALLRSKSHRHTVRTLGFGWTALAPTVILGGYLVAGLTGLTQVAEMQKIVTLHLSWGLLGWTGIVLFTTIFELVPMFYVAPGFPVLIKHWSLPSVFLLLVILTLSNFMPGAFLKASLVLIAMTFFVIGCYVLSIVYRRKRLIVDTTLLFIWTGVGSLLLAVVVWLSGGNDLLLGGLLLGGVCLTIPIGIIYKVIPFLCWFHLQGLLIRREKFDHTVPSMKCFIKEKEAKRQYMLHLIALCLLLMASQMPNPFAMPAGAVFLFSSLYLFKNILYAYIVFHNERRILNS
ncbi:MAG: hypothetical protein KZQ99_05500 [Candidatus Thiodiazotropha sp. (ex Dulcina madagascariensis)]|nr:hypothetical protein [Candidatus Thiodiazotropha sp. (ex Dulcina madagascariensis)]